MPDFLRSLCLRQRVYSLIILLTLAGSSSLQAAPPTVNPTQEIGSDSESFRRHSNPNLAQESTTPVIHLPSEEEAVAPDVALKEFYVKEIKIEGSQKISLKELQPIIARFNNIQLNLVKLYTIAKNITQYYRLKGYVTSRAFVPPQEIDNGVVTIKVVEGRLGKVTVSGNKLVSTDRLLSYMTLKPEDVIQYSKLLQGLLRMNRNPDRQVQAALAPGADSGTSDIILNVKEQNSLHFAFTVDNYGTRLSGRLRQGLIFEDSNLTGHDDDLYNTLNVSDSGGFLGEAVNYIYPVASTGGSITFSYSYSSVVLGKELKGLNVKGGANIWSLGYIQPVVQEANWSLDLDSGVDVKEIWSSINDQSNPSNNLRVIHVGPNLQMRDDWGVTTIKDDINFGAPGLFNGNGNPFYVDNLDLSRTQRFIGDSVLFAKLQAQMTGNALVSAQQLSAGGNDTVRGYDEGDSLGDYGFSQSTEWRIPPYFIPKSWTIPGRPETYWQTVQLLTFIDSALVHARYPGSGEDNEHNLMGAGLGMRINFTKLISSQVDCGWPIGDKPQDGSRSARWYFGINIRF